MLKLMKYEFIKARTMIAVIAGLLIATQCVFFYGVWKENYIMLGVGCAVTGMLALFAYLFVLFSGIISYSRELNNRTGYLTFMTPISPMRIVLSKLVFAVLSAIAVTAVIGAVTCADWRAILQRIELGRIDGHTVELLVRDFFGAETFTIAQFNRTLLTVGVSVLAGVISTMCAAFLSITMSATLLETHKGFVRRLLSIALFLVLTIGTNRLSACIRVDLWTAQMALVTAFDLGVSAVFAFASATLLDKRVSL